MNITLHKATEQVRELLEQLDPQTGELPEGFEQARAIVATKAVAVVAYIQESDRQTEMAEEYVKELQGRIKSSKRRQEWLKTYLKEHMAAAGIFSIKDERGIFSATLSIGRDEAVDVFYQSQIPQDYLREIPAKYEADKALIKKAINDGFEVPGASIIKKDRLTIK